MQKTYVDIENVGILNRSGQLSGLGFRADALPRGGSVAVLDEPTTTPVPGKRESGFQPYLTAITKLGAADVPLWRDIIERGLALGALVATLPAALVVALAIRLDSTGPALFRQWRVGRGGRLFRFTKFRTYHVDAKDLWPELYTYEYTPEELERLCFKVPGDPRATRVGKWLRQSTLDELPNFWHVLMGDMSLVGPRPEIPDMLPYYQAEELAKFTVKPGITGISQISGRGLLTFRETARLDLGYVRSRTLWGDIRIALTTVSKVIFRTGAF